jgi:hypothetical protein
MKVECKSAWLLHFTAALPIPSDLGHLTTQERKSGAAVPCMEFRADNCGCVTVLESPGLHLLFTPWGW